ncbi:MAG: hypothetical protein IBX72_02985 [Nitrospirae bacterium]|jgi:hypothetical protein|nr:hypothetical protein [Nitrospirota bacterium]
MMTGGMSIIISPSFTKHKNIRGRGYPLPFFIIGEAILWAEAKLGELLPRITQNYQSSGKGTLKQPLLPEGITKKQSHYAQILAENPEVIQEAKNFFKILHIISRYSKLERKNILDINNFF